MSAIMQRSAQDSHSFPYNPISDALKVSQIPVLPKRSTSSSVTSPVPRQHSQQASSTTSPPPAPSTSTSPEDYSSPSTAMSASPPANPATGDPENSQLPRPVTLPPRAKPGRKPATDTPVSKRKAQNREAQRNFRDRKRQREHEVQEQVRQREQEHLVYIRRIQEKHEQEMRQMREQSNATREQERLKIQSQLAEQNSALELQQRRNEELRAQVQELIKRQNATSGPETVQPITVKESTAKRKLSTQDLASQKSGSRPDSDSPRRQSNDRSSTDTVVKESQSPADQYNDEMEIDFTNMGKPSQHSNPSPFTPLDTDDSCGFCQANTYCACKDEMVNSGAPDTRTDSFIKPPPPKIIEPSAAPVGPGGCQACLDDPERRRICLAMASRRQDGPSVPLRPRRGGAKFAGVPASQQGDTSKRLPYPTPAPAYGINGPASGWQQSHMTCTDAITYGQQHDPNFHENWTKPEFIERLRVVKARDEDRAAEAKSSAQDVEIASIMAAMSASGDKSAATARRGRANEYMKTAVDDDDEDDG